MAIHHSDAARHHHQRGLRRPRAGARSWIAWTEGPPATVLLTIFVCASIGALVALLTRRLLFAAVITVAQVALVTTVSSLKLKYMNMVLHAYDITYYLMSITNLSFLVANYGSSVFAALFLVMLAALASAVVWRMEPARVTRPVAATLLFVFATGATAAGLSVERAAPYAVRVQGMYVSSFYRSWSETIETLMRGQLMEAAAAASVVMPPLQAQGKLHTVAGSAAHHPHPP